MKKFLSAIIATVMFFACMCCAVGCKKDLYSAYKKEIESEMKGSFDFFWNEVSLNETVAEGNLPTYGLIADRYPNKSFNASVASVGFGLTAYVIGVEEGWVTREEAQTRSLKTLQTMVALQNAPDVSYEGFLAHFINMNTGKRVSNVEISSVDTAILLCGAVAAGEYFGGEVKALADEFYGNVNWKAIERVRGGKTYLTMGYSQESQKLLGDWDWYAEQLMMYVLGAGSPVEEHRLDDTAYYDFARNEGTYNGHKFIYSWFGSIFTYQFSHAWIDFSGKKDNNGTDWHRNSVEASKAAYDFCRDRRDEYVTFAKGGWGLTACDTPDGYSGHLGAMPRGWQSDAAYPRIAATVAPCGAIGSVVFTPEESLKALKYYGTLRLLNGKYGLADAYNLDREWFATDCIGIDKGISLLMLSNYKDRTVWDTVMKNQNILLGLENLGFTAA